MKLQPWTIHFSASISPDGISHLLLASGASIIGECHATRSNIREAFDWRLVEAGKSLAVRHESFTERAPKLGGLIEFYRSPDRVLWTPTGINVPDYPKLAQLWWQQIGDVNSGAFTPQEAMDRLAGEMDSIMARMQAADEAANVYGGCGPRLNPQEPAEEWIGHGGAKAKLANEKPQGETIAYEEIIKRWQ